MLSYKLLYRIVIPLPSAHKSQREVDDNDEDEDADKDETRRDAEADECDCEAETCGKWVQQMAVKMFCN